MLPADVARCTGAKSVRGQPLPPCVQCERQCAVHRVTVRPFPDVGIHSIAVGI
jgi:hypothetical protein